MVDVTRFRAAAGLTGDQLARLRVLENSARLTPGQVGEARFLAHMATGSERERALKVAERAMPTPKPPDAVAAPTPPSEAAVGRAKQVADQRGWTFSPQPAYWGAVPERRGWNSGHTAQPGWGANI